jgi:DNA-binding protein HU-beta
MRLPMPSRVPRHASRPGRRRTDDPQFAKIRAAYGEAASGAGVTFAAIHVTDQEEPMTKGEFVEKVAAESGLNRKDAGAAVDAVLSTIESALKSGDDVNFTGFGKFHVAERGAREGRNPRTGESMQIAASKVPRFTAGSGLKKAIK